MNKKCGRFPNSDATAPSSLGVNSVFTLEVMGSRSLEEVTGRVSTGMVGEVPGIWKDLPNYGRSVLLAGIERALERSGLLGLSGRMALPSRIFRFIAEVVLVFAGQH